MLFTIARIILGTISLTTSLTFLTLLVQRRNQTMKATGEAKHQNSIIIVGIAIAADLLFGFIPCIIDYILIVERSVMANIVGPAMAVFYTFERMVMLASYLFVLRKRRSAFSNVNVLKSTSNDRS